MRPRGEKVINFKDGDTVWTYELSEKGEPEFFSWVYSCRTCQGRRWHYPGLEKITVNRPKWANVDTRLKRIAKTKKQAFMIFYERSQDRIAICMRSLEKARRIKAECVDSRKKKIWNQEVKK